MHEKQGESAEHVENADVALMTEEQLNEALTVVNKRILVAEELAEAPGLAAETILEERRKLDARKAKITEALNNLDDPFSRATGAHGQEKVLRKMEEHRDRS